MAQNDEAAILDEVATQWTDDNATVGVRGAKKGSCVLKTRSAYLERARSSGNKQLILQCEVLEHSEDPSSVGEKVLKRFQLEFNGPEGKKKLQMLNTALVNLGLSTTGLTNVKEQLPKLIEELNKGIAFNATIEPQDDPQFATSPNIYINANARRRDKEVPGSDSAAPEKPAGSKF